MLSVSSLSPKVFIHFVLHKRCQKQTVTISLEVALDVPSDCVANNLNNVCFRSHKLGRAGIFIMPTRYYEVYALKPDTQPSR